MFDVHNTCNTLLVYLTPVDIILSFLAVLYGFFNVSKFNKVQHWRSTLISCFIFAVVAEILIWQWMLGLLAFMGVLLMMVLQIFFVIDLLKTSKEYINDQLFVWGSRIEILVALAIGISAIVFSFTAIQIMNMG
ncbi:hypothetical protein [Limosilactobacillus oris]|uniref:hypothetical protein n=1 Tax=Limosilactobacillus oris TaxID=1632 RepID=UPI00388D6B74